MRFDMVLDRHTGMLFDYEEIAPQPGDLPIKTPGDQREPDRGPREWGCGKLLRVTSSDRRIEVEIRPPFLTIRANDVLSLFPRRKRTAGPFLIISVSSGLALDTAFRHGASEKPHLWAPHGKPQQLWYLKPSGHANEVLIVSALNGLVLDAGRGQGHRVQMCAEKDAAWQRWRLAPSPDRMAHVLASVGTGTVLHCPSGAEQTAEPVMREPAERDNQQWLFLLPFGAPDN